MNVRTWLAVSVYMVIVQAFVALKDGVGPHTGERRLKYGHFFAGTLYFRTLVRSRNGGGPELWAGQTATCPRTPLLSQTGGSLSLM